MANDEDLARLRQGVAAWNNWRGQNRECFVDLSEADLREANLGEANLGEADLYGADLYLANFSGANLSGAILEHATLVETDFAAADLTGCHVYGISTWDLNLDGAKQSDLVITSFDQPEITVLNGRDGDICIWWTQAAVAVYVSLGVAAGHPKLRAELSLETRPAPMPDHSTGTTSPSLSECSPLCNTRAFHRRRGRCRRASAHTMYTAAAALAAKFRPKRRWNVRRDAYCSEMRRT
jgi:hypothetical protein